MHICLCPGIDELVAPAVVELDCPLESNPCAPNKRPAAGFDLYVRNNSIIDTRSYTGQDYEVAYYRNLIRYEDSLLKSAVGIVSVMENALFGDLRSCTKIMAAVQEDLNEAQSLRPALEDLELNQRLNLEVGIPLADSTFDPPPYYDYRERSFAAGVLIRIVYGQPAFNISQLDPVTEQEIELMGIAGRLAASGVALCNLRVTGLNGFTHNVQQLLAKVGIGPKLRN